MTKKKKKVDLMRHFIRRALQRYGLTINKGDYDYINSQIPNSLVGFKTTNGRSQHLIDFKGELMIVCYDKKRSGVVTVLPKESMLQEPFKSVILEREHQ